MIKLPEKEVCATCDGFGRIGLLGVECHRCGGDGYRWDFDAVAEALENAEIEMSFPRKIDGEWEMGFNDYYGNEKDYIAKGPSPTLALVAAINKYNEEANGE